MKDDINKLNGLRECPQKGCAVEDNHLESVLNRLFPNELCIYNKFIKDAEGKYITVCGHKIKPDALLPNCHLIIEIDGESLVTRCHFSNARVATMDIYKDKILKQHGYTIIRIPPYVQLDADMIKYYFSVDYNKDLYSTCHDHGFDHPLITLPADYCHLGVKRFERDMTTLPLDVRKSIIESLRRRINTLVLDGLEYDDAISAVIPDGLRYLLD